MANAALEFDPYNRQAASNEDRGDGNVPLLDESAAIEKIVKTFTKILFRNFPQIEETEHVKKAKSVSEILRAEIKRENKSFDLVTFRVKIAFSDQQVFLRGKMQYIFWRECKLDESMMKYAAQAADLD